MKQFHLVLSGVLISLALVGAGCGTTKESSQMPTPTVQENAPSPQKIVTWCDGKAEGGPKDSSIRIQNDGYWFVTEHFSGTNHAPDVFHVCRGKTDLVSVTSVDWKNMYRFATEGNKASFVVDAGDAPAFSLLEEKMKSLADETWMKLGTRTIVYDEKLNTFKEFQTAQTKKITWSTMVGIFNDNTVLYAGEVYQLDVQDSAVILNVPQERLSKRVADILMQDKQKDVWFGLLGSLSEVVKNGEKIEMSGFIDNATKRIQARSIKIIQ